MGTPGTWVSFCNSLDSIGTVKRPKFNIKHMYIYTYLIWQTSILNFVIYTYEKFKRKQSMQRTSLVSHEAGNNI